MLVEPAADAFVIWLDPPRAKGSDVLHGLVEHVPTTTRVRFASAAELVAFVRAARRPPGGGAPDASPSA